MVLEQREDDMYQDRDYISVLHSQIGLVTHLNDGKSQDVQNLKQDKQNLEQENEAQKAIIEKQNERLRKYKIDDKYLRKQLAKKDRINQDLHDQLKDVNMLCRYVHVIIAPFSEYE